VENNLIGAGKRFAVVVSGANMNFGRLRFVAERAELGEGREVLFSVEIPETPGKLPSFSSLGRDSLLRFLKAASCDFIILYFPEQ
jgi:threonine dehydratase